MFYALGPVHTPSPPARGAGVSFFSRKPDALSIEAAIEANNEFIASLERIRDQAQRTLEHSA
jgi:hypothetical protein